MSKTPTRSSESTQFTAKEIVSPNKDHPGISKTVFSHVSNIHGLLNDWIKLRDTGVKLLKAVSALKLHECYDDHYPQPLTPLMGHILEIKDSLKNVVEGIRILNDQLQALAKLQPTDHPVILTWSASQISENVGQIYDSLIKEYRLKEVITENIAHCRDEKLIEVYASSWELEAYFNYELHAYLFADVGLLST